MHKRILVADRGLGAYRVFEAILNLRGQGADISATLIHSDYDSQTLPVIYAKKSERDNTINFGLGDSNFGNIGLDRILEISGKYNIGAIHPGYSHLATDINFSSMATIGNIDFVGPYPRIITLADDRLEMKKEMALAGLNTIPGSLELIDSLEKAVSSSEVLGFPVSLQTRYKRDSTAKFVFNGPDELKEFFDYTVKSHNLSEIIKYKLIERGFVIEKHLENPLNYFEIQALGDNPDIHGNLITFPLRECTIKSGGVSLISESPSPNSSYFTKGIESQAFNLLRKIKFSSTGSVKFVRIGEEVYAVGLSPYLQCGHQLSEEITGIDLVAEQIKIAANMGLSYKQEGVSISGHSIQCRILAKDSSQVGKYVVYHDPKLDSARYETIIPGIHKRNQSFSLSSFYDLTLGVVTAKAPSRGECVEQMQKALGKLKLTGIETNIPLLLSVLNTEDFRSGTYDSNLVQRTLANIK